MKKIPVNSVNTVKKTPHPGASAVKTSAVPVGELPLEVPEMVAPPQVDELWTISTFHKMTGVDRRTIETRFLEAKIYPAKTVTDRNKHESGLYRVPEGLRAIYINQPNSSSRLKEAQARKLELSIAKQEAIDAGELMRTDDVIRIMTTGIKQLDTIDDWAKNEINLSPAAIKAKTDEIRTIWAAEVRNLAIVQPKQRDATPEL